MEVKENKDSKKAMNIGDLVRKISSMSVDEKKKFCKTLSKEERKQYIDYLKDRDSEEVEVVFKCFEPMGGMVKFTAIPYENVGGTYEFYDGMTYRLPICIARRFNNEFQGAGTFYPTHSYIMDAQGKPILGVGKKNFRFGTNSPNLM